MRHLTPAQRAAVTRDRIERARLWLIPCSLLWIPLGLGTMRGLAGKPTDAPHLLIPEMWRGVVWVTTALAALVVLIRDREHTEDATRTAAALLLIMPMVRAASYSVAGIYSVVDLDGPGVGLRGSPEAYYTAQPWIVISLAILTQAVNWRGMARYWWSRFDKRIRGRAGE